VFPGFEALPGSRKANRDYIDHDIGKLLAWTDGQLKVDASVRFNTNLFPLARADDRAIERLLADYFGREGCFVCYPTDVWTLTNGPYDRTRLRDRQLVRQHWRLVVAESELEFFRKERIERGGSLIDVWLKQTMTICPKHENAWLCLSPREMVTLCEEVGISTEDGMEVELGVFSEQDRFEFDEGFGILRVHQ
jgi:CRISPR-associated endonuclease/helicase Cas3